MVHVLLVLSADEVHLVKAEEDVCIPLVVVVDGHVVETLLLAHRFAHQRGFAWLGDFKRRSALTKMTHFLDEQIYWN